MLAYKNLDLKQVKWLAQKLAMKLTKHHVNIGLVGRLGAGKTTFIKAFAGQLGAKKVSSPTFVVTHEHQIKLQKIYHLDFYRLHKKADLGHLGLDEILNSDGIVLVEWVDKFPKIAKQCDLIIKFKVKPRGLRDITIKAN